MPVVRAWLCGRGEKLGPFCHPSLTHQAAGLLQRRARLALGGLVLLSHKLDSYRRARRTSGRLHLSVHLPPLVFPRGDARLTDSCKRRPKPSVVSSEQPNVRTARYVLATPRHVVSA